MSDIVVTWPKTRTLGSYLSELARAQEAGHVAYFRILRGPKNLRSGDRCYQLHDGKVHGWLEVMGLRRMGGNVIDEVTGLAFKEGLYIERKPLWHPIEPTPMKGFRGFRYWKG